MSAGDLCEPRHHEEFGWLKCGRVILERDPTGPEACPSYGGGGLLVCADCFDAVTDFMERAYDARARRKEWEEDQDFEPLP